MLQIDKYNQVLRNVEKAINIKDMSIMDMININAQILTAYIAAQCHDKPEVTEDLESFKADIRYKVDAITTGQLSYLKQDMEKYKC